MEGTDESSTAAAGAVDVVAADVGRGGIMAFVAASDPPLGRPDLAGMTSWSWRFNGFLEEVGGGLTSTYVWDQSA